MSFVADGVDELGGLVGICVRGTRASQCAKKGAITRCIGSPPSRQCVCKARGELASLIIIGVHGSGRRAKVGKLVVSSAGLDLS